MFMSKFLDLDGLNYFVDKIKSDISVIGQFLIANQASHNWAEFNMSNLPDGYYLIIVKNAVTDDTWYGLSTYLWQKIENTLKVFTPVNEVANAKITNFSITNGICNLDFDALGYHTVIAKRIV